MTRSNRIRGGNTVSGGIAHEHGAEAIIRKLRDVLFHLHLGNGVGSHRVEFAAFVLDLVAGRADSPIARRINDLVMLADKAKPIAAKANVAKPKAKQKAKSKTPARQKKR